MVLAELKKQLFFRMLGIFVFSSCTIASASLISLAEVSSTISNTIVYDILKTGAASPIGLLKVETVNSGDKSLFLRIHWIEIFDKYQGRGSATAALNLLWIKFENISFLEALVNPYDIAAVRLYENSGFEIVESNEINEMLKMVRSRDLHDPEIDLNLN